MNASLPRCCSFPNQLLGIWSWSLPIVTPTSWNSAKSQVPLPKRKHRIHLTAKVGSLGINFYLFLPTESQNSRFMKKLLCKEAPVWVDILAAVVSWISISWPKIRPAATPSLPPRRVFSEWSLPSWIGWSLMDGRLRLVEEPKWVMCTPKARKPALCCWRFEPSGHPMSHPPSFCPLRDTCDGWNMMEYLNAAPLQQLCCFGILW